MNDAIHTEYLRGYRIEIFYDNNCDYADDDVHGKILLLDTQQWNIPHDGIVSTTSDDDRSLRELCDELSRDHVRLALPIMRDEHGPQSRYWVTHPPAEGWDSQCVGFLVYTDQRLHEWGTHVNATDEYLLEMMQAEMQELTDWANGNCWGYQIFDCNGDPVDSCWGYICDYDGFVLSEARDAVPDEPTPPLYTLRLTAQEMATVACSVLGVPGGESIIVKCKEAANKEET